MVFMERGSVRGGKYEVNHIFHPLPSIGEPSQELLFSADGDVVLSSTRLLLRLAVEVQLLFQG